MALAKGTRVRFNITCDYMGKILSQYRGEGIVEREGDFPILGETYQVRVVTAETPDAQAAMGGCLEAKRSSLTVL